MNIEKSALSGIKIIDFSHVYQGPVGSQLLADYGADVLKVERPGFGDWSRHWGPYAGEMSLPFAGLNRNKRSITLDVKSEGGKKIIYRLLESADVLMHNFRPGVMEKLGLGYEDLKKINPRLVYAQSSGWGDKGPYVDQRRSGHDMLARAASGWFNNPDQSKPPQAIGISSDYPAGLMLIIGILIALQGREKTGAGQKVSTDLFSVSLHANAWEGTALLNKEAIDNHEGIGKTEAAIDKIFKTKDGYIEVSPVFSEDSLRDISLAMGLDNLSLDSRFADLKDRLANRNELNTILGGHFLTMNTGEWMALLEPKGVLCTEVRSFTEAVKDPQTAANEMLIDLEHPGSGNLRLLGTPVRLHGTGPICHTPAPGLGENNEEVLAELGYDADEIESFTQSGALG